MTAAANSDYLGIRQVEVFGCAVSCTPTAGKYTESSCSVCAANSYEVRPGSALENAGGTSATAMSCVTCPEFTYSVGIGNVECSSCNLDSAGLFNAECSQCPTNQYSSKPGGAYLSHTETCTDCPRLMYNVGQGNAGCVDCPVTPTLQILPSWDAAARTVTVDKYGPECSNCPMNTKDSEPGMNHKPTSLSPLSSLCSPLFTLVTVLSTLYSRTTLS